MSDQIIDLVEVGIPGATGDVTPAAVAARDAAILARNESQAARDASEEWRDQAEVFSGTVVAFQDAAVATLIDTPGSETQTQLNATFVRSDSAPISVQRFGAKGDGVTDDTASIQAAIDYAQTLVREASTGNKQMDGATVYFPKGLYLLTSSVTVSESGIHLLGESSSASRFYAPNADFDLVVFDNLSWALYNCGISNLGWLTPGNATAGFHLTVAHVIYFVANNLLFNGWFGGLRIVGSGKVMFSSVNFSQETRDPQTTLTGAAIQLDDHFEYGYPSDIHFTDIQVMENYLYAGYASVIINAGDGIYFSNSHLHGTFLVDPSGAVPIYTLIFNNVYFDGSRDVNFILGGTPMNGYQDVRFTNCYFRGGVVGLRVSPGCMLKSLNVTACLFAQNKYNGIEITNANVTSSIINACIFEDNNSENDPAYGDVKVNGVGVTVSNLVHHGGGAAGYGIMVESGAEYVVVSGINFANSTVGYMRRIVDGGTQTSLSSFLGWTAKGKYTATIPSGVTQATLPHGVLVPPTLQSISLTPGAACPAYWVSDITVDSFRVNFATATSAAFTMGYVVDMES